MYQENMSLLLYDFKQINWSLLPMLRFHSFLRSFTMVRTSPTSKRPLSVLFLALSFTFFFYFPIVLLLIAFNVYKIKDL